MDISLFSKKLSKISVIVDSTSDGTELSPLERDLLLSYIRDLYDIALDGAPIQKPAHKTPKVEPVYVPPVVETVVNIPTPPVAKPVEPTVEVPIAEVKVEAPKVEHIPVEKVIETPPVEKVQVATAPIPAVTSKPNLSSHSADVQELFEEAKVNDLSDKLSLTPIKDLTRSMGINERVHNQAELFANNRDHFVEVLDALNKMENFEQATSYILSNLIDKYDWTNDKRSKQAAQFIKLVKRRYL
jgi:hypothetical protein